VQGSRFLQLHNTQQSGNLHTKEIVAADCHMNFLLLTSALEKNTAADPQIKTRV
jgi:hypothetical protein